MRIFAYNIIIMVGKGTITMRETRILEFKETITNIFLKTVSAFSNYNGGMILFGVDDDGNVKGLVARGGFVVDMDWKNVHLTKAVIYSRIGGTIRLRSYIPLKGKGLKRASGDCPNELLCQAEVASPLISKKLSNPEKPELKRIYEYDLKTEPGKRYVVYAK